MSTIAIRDLPENTDLDHQAMRAITGGSRFGRRPLLNGPLPAQARQLFNYPASSGAGQGRGQHPAKRRRQPADQGQQGAGGGDMGIGEGRQPLVAQAQETAQRRQDQRQAEAGQERNQKDVIPHQKSPSKPAPDRRLC